LSLLRHVARLGNDTPAHQALWRQIDISLRRLPDRTWKRPTGRPRSKTRTHRETDKRDQTHYHPHSYGLYSLW